jgi:site-specific recombinase XerD
MSTLAPTLQAWFTERLIGQRAASPNTIGAYKTTLRLLLVYASQRNGKTPSALDVADIDAPLIIAFLDHLERDRHNRVATRNNRLAAIHSLFAYLALHHPEHAPPSSGCSPSHPSAANATWSPTSPTPRSTRC